RGDYDGVNVLLAVEHFAKVGIASGFGEALGFELDHAIDASLGFDGIERRAGLAGRRRGGQLDAFLQALDIEVKAIKTFVGVRPVHIAESDDVLAGEIDEIRAAHAADANGGDVERVAGRSDSAAKNVSGNNGERGAAGGIGQEGSTRD